MAATNLTANLSQPLSTVQYLLEGYWNEYGDPRTAKYTIMTSIGPLLSLLAVYASFVLFLGPRLMRNRKPLSLKSALLVYNFIMTFWNAYFFYRVILVDYNYGLDMFNMKFPSFTDQSPAVQSKISLGHMYLISKLFDLLDTVFFVLRKKNSQITWLHFYHHLTVPFFGWVHFRLCGTNSVVIPFGLMNSFIHTLMYAYYGLAAFGPHMQKYLWWKRYITQIQIIQFILLFVYGLAFMVLQEGYAFFFTYNMLIQSLMYMYLFSRFYFKTYKKTKNDLGSESTMGEVKKEL